MTMALPDNRGVAITGGMPGWRIAADLTPREVVEGRRLRALRRLVAVALVATVALCLLALAGALLRESTEERALASAQEQTSMLRTDRNQYAEVIEIQADTRTVESQIADLMKTHTDTARLLTQMRNTLPGSMTISSMTVALPTSGPDQASGGTTGSGAGQDLIGTATLAGTSRELRDLAEYADNLQGIPGITEILPASNTSGDEAAVTWTVTLALTSALHTHQYDVDPKGETG